jgi:hypothetical protein
VMDHPGAVLSDTEIFVEDPIRYKPRRFPFG